MSCGKPRHILLGLGLRRAGGSVSRTDTLLDLYDLGFRGALGYGGGLGNAVPSVLITWDFLTGRVEAIRTRVYVEAKTCNTMPGRGRCD